VVEFQRSVQILNRPILPMPNPEADKAKPSRQQAKHGERPMAEIENELFRYTKLPDAFAMANKTITKGSELKGERCEGLWFREWLITRSLKIRIIGSGLRGWNLFLFFSQIWINLF